jgi:hypothetical protein
MSASSRTPQGQSSNSKPEKKPIRADRPPMELFERHSPDLGARVGIGKPNSFKMNAGNICGPRAGAKIGGISVGTYASHISVSI